MKASREVAIGCTATKTPREVRLEALLRRALEAALPGGLEDPEGCTAEGEWAVKLFEDARRELAGAMDATMMTAIGPGATVDKPGDFAVAITEGGCLTITQDGDASWTGSVSLKQAAHAAAETLVKALWGEPPISEAARALVLTRLYDRMDHDAREASLAGARTAKETLAFFLGREPMLVVDPSEEDVARSVALLNAFEEMIPLERWAALNRLILVGLDVSRRFKRHGREDTQRERGVDKGDPRVARRD